MSATLLVNTQHRDHTTSELQVATYCTETGNIIDYSIYDDKITDDPQELPPSSDTADQSRSNESSEAPTQRVSRYDRPLRYRDMIDT